MYVELFASGFYDDVCALLVVDECLEVGGQRVVGRIGLLDNLQLGQVGLDVGQPEGLVVLVPGHDHGHLSSVLFGDGSATPLAEADDAKHSGQDDAADDPADNGGNWAGGVDRHCSGEGLGRAEGTSVGRRHGVREGFRALRSAVEPGVVTVRVRHWVIVNLQRK